LYRDCAKNTWLKIHKPDIYFAEELGAFEQQIIETGNEVDVVARGLSPHGIFQKRFENEKYLTITDILEETKNGYEVIEVKATNDIDKSTHYHDLAFQINVLEMEGFKIESANILHLNKDYKREGELNLSKLFKIEDVTEKIEEIKEEVLEEMEKAFAYINQKEEPRGFCSCVYRGRSAHCTTFHYSNPSIPEYSIHDLARIGQSKKKLIELVDGKYFHIHEIPENMELSQIQKNQIQTYIHDHIIHEDDLIKEEFDKLVFPLYFVDYETFPAALPRFDGFSPYEQIPFQFSLHILRAPDALPEHVDFLYTKKDDPSKSFAEALRDHIGAKGSIVVWHKGFECGRNGELGARLPEYRNFFRSLEERIFDLEDIFKKQHYVHKDFRGSSSIKKILPVLVPELSYKELNIKEGGAAADIWNKIVTKEISEKEKEQAIKNLKEYCKLDTYAMYAIWKKLYNLL